MSVDEANRIARNAQRLKLSRGAKIALPTAAALGAGAALAIGAIPSSGGTITGCFLTNTDIPGPNSGGLPGKLRLIDPGTPGPNFAGQCGTNESTITWNQQGPPGQTGQQGPPGTPGTPGTPGAQGAQGAPLLGGTDFAISGNSSKLYLKIEGIKGESQDTGHKGDLTIESFSFGSLPASQGSANGSGGGAGKVKFADLTIKKVVDKASASLFQHAANGVHYKEATITVRKAGKGQQDFLKFDFKDVIISSYKIVSSGGGETLPTEQITLNFTKVLQTFYKQDKALGTLTIAPNTYTVAG